MAGNKNSGRHRKSSARLKLHGTFNVGRHGGRVVESRVSGHPDCPDGLNGPAQWLWDMVVIELAEAGVAKRIDTAHLWAMCEVWSLYRTSAEIAKVDPTDKDARIAVVSYLAAFESAAAKCGLTPADRAKLEIDPPAETDEFGQFLSEHA